VDGAYDNVTDVVPSFAFTSDTVMGLRTWHEFKETADDRPSGDNTVAQSAS